MKTKILVLTLLLGLVGSVHAGGRSGQGWNVTVMTGTHLTIGDGSRRVFLKSITLSTDTSAGIGNYLMAFSTQPNIAVNGSDASLFGGPLFQSTAALVPAIVFQSTTSANQVGAPSLNYRWSAGECEDCYIEVAPSDSNGRGAALTIRKTAVQVGQALQAIIQWSN